MGHTKLEGQITKCLYMVVVLVGNSFFRVGQSKKCVTCRRVDRERQREREKDGKRKAKKGKWRERGERSSRVESLAHYGLVDQYFSEPPLQLDKAYTLYTIHTHVHTYIQRFRTGFSQKG